MSADTRYRLAADAFSTVAAYYAEIAAYLNQISNNAYPQRLAMVLEKVADLPYGENPHQRAAFYRETTHRSGTLADATQLQGAQPTFNNLLDLDAAYRIAARLHGADRRRSPSTRTRSASRRARSWSRPTGGRWTRTRSRRSAGSSASTASSTARPPARSPPTRTRRSSRPASARPRSGSCADKQGLELLAVPASPSEGMRDYGIANLDFKRVGGGLLVEALDARRPRPRPAPGRDPAPPDARRADRPPVRVARGAPRPLERDRPRPQRARRSGSAPRRRAATCRWTSPSAGPATARSSR